MEQLHIDMEEVARYLGYGTTLPEEETMADITWAVESLRQVATPRATHQVFPLAGTALVGTTLTLEGQDIKSLLSNSHHCIVLAVTLGQGVDNLLRKLSVSHLPRSVVADVCASSMIEGFCQDVCNELEKTWREKGRYLTPRFSAGYGDLPLVIQGDICTLLNSQKTIGLTATSTQILTPRKSITAIIGIQDQPLQPTPIGCASCNLAGHCSYRKGGTSK